MNKSAAFRSFALFFLFAGAALLGRPAWAFCAPSAKSILPASGIVGTQVSATVTGGGLAGAVAGTFGGAGLGVAVQATSDTSVTLQLTIDAAAATGERIITLTTSDGVVAVSFTVNPAGGPIVTGVSPTLIATQGFGFQATLTGQNLGNLSLSDVSTSGAGVVPSLVSPSGDGTSAAITFTVAADADIGTHALVIASATGGATFQLYVQRPAPSVVTVSPSAGAVGANVPITITGTNLAGAALVVTSGAAKAGGVAISQIVSSDTMLTATLSISASLSPESEPRLLILTTESGQVTAEFSVVAGGVPTITGIRPGAASPGQTANATLRGLGLTGALVSTVTPGLAVQNATIVDDQTITLQVVVSPAAVVGTNGTITASVGLNSTSASFVVIATGAPYVGAVRPPFGNRGATMTLVLDGVNLGAISSVNLGQKIAVSNVTAPDSQTGRAILDIDPNASAGYRGVAVTTAGGTYVASSAFRVNIPGQVPILTDVSPTVVTPGVTTPMVVTGSGLAGAGVSVGGPGATTSNIVVLGGGTSVTFDLTLAPDATAENRPLIVVTEFGSATCGVLSLVPKPVLDAADLLKTGAAFEVKTPGFRLFVFEFSINDRFDAGLRTFDVESSAALTTLTRLQARDVGRAVRDLPFGFVRVRAVTATDQIGTSDAARFRR